MSPDWMMPFSIDTAILSGMKLPPRQKLKSPPKPVAEADGAGSRQTTLGKSALSRAHPEKAGDSLPLTVDEGALRECLGGICEQDQAALSRLYDLTVSRVYSVALRIVRRVDLAEEVVSDVYVQVWRDARRYDDTRGKVLGWLLIIARSRALDLLRRQDEAFSHPEPYDLVAEPESAQHLLEDWLAADQEHRALHAALERLSPIQRQLLSLAFFRGLSHQEIAEQSRMPLGTVKTHIRRALGELRKSLETTEHKGAWS